MAKFKSQERKHYVEATNALVKGKKFFVCNFIFPKSKETQGSVLAAELVQNGEVSERKLGLILCDAMNRYRRTKAMPSDNKGITEDTYAWAMAEHGEEMLQAIKQGTPPKVAVEQLAKKYQAGDVGYIDTESAKIMQAQYKSLKERTLGKDED